MNPIIRTKESIAILEQNPSEYTFIFTANRKVKQFHVDLLIKDIIKKTSEVKPLDLLIKDLLNNYSYSKIQNAIGALENEGIIRIQTSEMDDRYKRQIMFIDELTSSWDETIALHNKIRNTRFSVFGAGGIGSWMINGIYQIGTKDITLIDPDVVEESNLNRQIGYGVADIGKYKVDVWKEKLSDIQVNTHKLFVDEKTNLNNIMNNTDFIINCADEPAVHVTTQLIDSYAQPRKIPYCVAGGYNLHLGMIGPIIVPNKTKTFDDFLQYQKDNDPLINYNKIKDVEQSGNLGPIAGTIANLQLMEVFKHIIGKGEVNYNKFAEVDFMNFGVDWRQF